MTVEKVERDTPRAEELLHFIETSSWEEAKDHLADMIRRWEFAGDEAVFAAVAGDRIVGMATFLMTDYYPLPDLFPWVSSIYVDEAYRCRRISGTLIEQANAYAKSRGYEKTYIPSSFFGLYEKYGYRYLRDIVNYGGDTDHLFVKEL
ncbi:MAG: GNAT family N-acetyltransferase [Clostridia bacterium]|nr:GNAT family N-acetyltransferase [Clostridia bacterium]